MQVSQGLFENIENNYYQNTVKWLMHGTLWLKLCMLMLDLGLRAIHLNT